MKSAFSTIILTVCAGAAMAQDVPSPVWNQPESFTLHNSATRDPIKRLFALDNDGMYLAARFGPTDVLPYEIGIELVGHVNPRSFDLQFGVAQASNSNDALTLRIEQFNYVSREWNVIASVTSGSTIPDGNYRPFVAPFTTVKTSSAKYVSSDTGEVRTRVYWTSPHTFERVWVDFAGWASAN